jgi:cation:H+ antiporter
MLPVLLFVVGLILLIKGGDWFVDGAVGIAHRFNMPEILIGATVVSIGTTLPEVMVSAGSAVKGIGSMAYGNALGSIICNTALIAAITIAVKPSDVDRKSMKTPVIFFTLAALVYVFISYFTGSFSRISGILLLILFVVYMIIAVKQALNITKTPKTESSDTEGSDDNNNEGSKKEASVIKFIVLLVVGAALIAVGADLLVDNGTIIAERLGVPSTVIALTFVALGTSLPELVTAVTSLIKGSGALSLGNIIGANMFNLVLVSGLSISLAPFDVPCDKLIGGINSSLVIDIPVMILVSCILIIPALIRGKMARIQGILMLAIYAAFCIFQFVI